MASARPWNTHRSRSRNETHTINDERLSSRVSRSWRRCAASPEYNPEPFPGYRVAACPATCRSKHLRPIPSRARGTGASVWMAQRPLPFARIRHDVSQCSRRLLPRIVCHCRPPARRCSASRRHLAARLRAAARASDGQPLYRSHRLFLQGRCEPESQRGQRAFGADASCLARRGTAARLHNPHRPPDRAGYVRAAAGHDVLRGI